MQMKSTYSLFDRKNIGRGWQAKFPPRLFLQPRLGVLDLDLEKGLAEINRQLGHDGNGADDIPVKVEVVAELLVEDAPVLEPLVRRLVAVQDEALRLLVVRRIHES